MTSAALHVPRQPPLPSPQQWFQVAPPPQGWVGTDGISNCVTHNGKTYFGYMDGDGNARVGVYDHTARTFTASPVIVSTGQAADVHATPAILIRSSDSKILMVCIPHNSNHVYVAVSTNALDVSAWGTATDIASTIAGSGRYTYANLFQLSGESGKVYLFYRDQTVAGPPANNVLCYSTSTDGGSTWAAGTQLFKNATTAYCLWAIDSDNTSRIDFVASNGSAAQDTTADLYHFYYSGGSYYKPDGTLISTSPPLGPGDATKIYDGATNGLVRVPYCAINGPSPYATWATYDTAGSGANEHYWYGTCSAGGTWTTNQIVDTGAPPTSGISEGGAYIDRTDSTKVFVSREISGYLQVCLYATSNGGTSWTSTQLTFDQVGQIGDGYNIRPISPRNAVTGLRALWCMGPHCLVNADNEGSFARIRGYPNPVSVF